MRYAERRYCIAFSHARKLKQMNIHKYLAWYLAYYIKSVYERALLVATVLKLIEFPLDVLIQRTNYCFCRCIQEMSNPKPGS
jgi:hypothetical protein